MVSFPDAIKMFFKRYVDFKGRSSRAEYWWVALLNFFVFFLFGLMSGAWSAAGEPSDAAAAALGVPIMLYLLVMFIPSLALLVRRLHDTNKSGWLAIGMVLAAIPIVGILVSLVYIVLCCLKGTEGSNRFGEAPGATAEA